MIRNKDNKGFSLLEILIALSILIILVGLITPQVLRYVEQGRQAYDKNTVDTAMEAAKLAYVEDTIHGIHPASGDSTTFYYNAETGKAEKEAPAKGYGRSANKLDGTNGNIDDGTTAHNAPKANYLTLTVSNDGATIAADWGKPGTPAAEHKVTSSNPSPEVVAAIDKYAVAYTNVKTETQAYIEAHKSEPRKGLAQDNGHRDGMNYRIYVMDEKGNIIPQGKQDDTARQTAWDTSYHMPEAGSAIIDGQSISWNKNDVVQIAYREKGTLEVSVAKDKGKLWMN